MVPACFMMGFVCDVLHDWTYVAQSSARVSRLACFLRGLVCSMLHGLDMFSDWFCVLHAPRLDMSARDSTWVYVVARPGGLRATKFCCVLAP